MLQSRNNLLKCFVISSSVRSCLCVYVRIRYESAVGWWVWWGRHPSEPPHVSQVGPCPKSHDATGAGQHLFPVLPWHEWLDAGQHECQQVQDCWISTKYLFKRCCSALLVLNYDILALHFFLILCIIFSYNFAFYIHHIFFLFLTIAENEFFFNFILFRTYFCYKIFAFFYFYKYVFIIQELKSTWLICSNNLKRFIMT